MKISSNYYLRNPKLKKSGVKQNFTPDQIIEYTKCAADPIYFIENYCKIIHVDHGIVKFKLYEYQRRMIKTFEDNRFSICKLPRQSGKCVDINTIVTIRDKNTKKVFDITIGDFYELVSKEQRQTLEEFGGNVGLQFNDHLGSGLQEITSNSSSGVSKLSDSVNRKFIDVVPATNYDVLTDSGWQQINFVNKTIKYVEWKLITNNHDLICADDHIVFRPDGSEVFVKDLQIGDKIITKDGLDTVVSVMKTNKSSNMFDLTVNSIDHRFYTNGILSHNSTVVAGYIIWNILFKSNQNIAIVANKDKQAREILTRVKFMYENLELWMQMGVKTWNKGDIELDNNSKVITGATTSSSIRGGSYTMVYCDEFAHVLPHLQDEFYKSTYPTISSGNTTKIIITSTPKGLELFYKFWTLSEQGKNTYARVDIHWSETPGRDEKWKEEIIANTSEEDFLQEFSCEFKGSSNTLINGRFLAKMPFIDPIESTYLGLKVFAAPQEAHSYVSVVDTARGVNGDYSAFVLFDVTTIPYRVVASFRNKAIAPMAFPNIIVEGAKVYNKAMILCETNDIGQQIADIIFHDLEYENLLMTETSKKEGQSLSMNVGFDKMNFGVKTTKQVKRIGCMNLKSLVENHKLIVEDLDIIGEFSRFVQKGTSYEATEGHDDLAMCCVLFGWLTTQKLFRELALTDLRNSFIEQNDHFIEEGLVPAGMLLTGHEEEDHQKMWGEDDIDAEFNSRNKRLRSDF